jgi:hypothetical protein
MSGLGLATGRIITNTALPTFKSYDYMPLRSALQAVPSNRAQLDFTDPDQRVLEDTNRIAQVSDLSRYENHAIAADTERPNLVADAIHDTQGRPILEGAEFDGSMGMTVASLLRGQPRITAAFLFRAPNADGTSRMLASDGDTASQNFYLTDTSVRMYSAVPSLTGINPTVGTNWAIFCADHSTDDMRIISNLGTVSGANTVAPLTGDFHIGKWATGQSDNRLIGNLADVMVFEEDLSTNDTVLNLVRDYFTRKARH